MELRIKPVRTLFFDSDSFYGIYGAEVHPEDLTNHFDGRKHVLNSYGNISIKGIMPKLNQREEYIVKVKKDESSGARIGTYIVEGIRQDRPVTVAQQRQYLEAVLTPRQAMNIFEVYSDGEDIIGMIEDGTFDYSKVSGLGEKTFQKLREKVMNNAEMGELLIFLNKYGIKYNMINKLIKEYGNPAIVIAKIEENPYLLTEVKGVGFKKADEIAKAVGYSMTSSHRIESCIRFSIGEENQNGHSWMGRKQLLNRCIEYLNIDKKYIEAVLNNGANGIINREDRFTRKEIWEAETTIAAKIAQFKVQSKPLFKKEELDKFLDDYCEKNNVELEKHQRAFFYDFNENNVLFLVGGGGMGKTWLQTILLELIKKKSLRTALLAPTGKASKVVQGYTGQLASTIHRKIGVYDSDEDAINQVNDDIFIIDESSMCDVFILSKFFNAVTNNNAKILFVGDDFQLPSVGVGNFLYDCINSDIVTISKLYKVFRQAEGGILNVATDTREGKQFLDDAATGRHQFGKDCVFHLADSAHLTDGYLHYYKKVLNKFDPEDIVILSPTKKGKLGTVAINQEIQKVINPASSTKKEKTFGRDFPVTFRVGDAVMNTVNSYQVETFEGGTADVFNGDTGKIVDIIESDKVIVVDFEGIKVKMKFETILTTLLHCWAMTIHKSQGSQYKVVITIIDRSMKYQLNANLMYTAFSRAKDYLLVLGQAEAINHGIKKFANMERKSFLQELLDEYSGKTQTVVDGYTEPKVELEIEDNVTDYVAVSADGFVYEDYDERLA